MSAETTPERIIRILDELKPLVAKLVPLLHDLEDLNPYDGITVDRLEISRRASTGLKEAGAKTIGDVRAMTDYELLRTPNFGRKSLKEIRGAIQRREWAGP